MTRGYEQSAPYQLGLMYRTMGELLMNPETTVRELQNAASDFGVRLQFAIVPGEEKSEVES